MISVVPPLKRLLFSCLTACLLFVLLLDGRYEVFYWISSICNHLLSIVFFLLSLSCLLNQDKKWLAVPAYTLLFFTGFMNEVYALCFCLILLCMAFLSPSAKGRYVIGVCLIILALMLNFFSAGTAQRLGEATGSTAFANALQDSFHSFLYPFYNYRYLPFKLLTGVIFALSVRHYFKLELFVSTRFYVLNRILVLTLPLTILAQCWLLRIPCPFRGLIFFNLVIIYFLFLYSAKKKVQAF